uniref:Indole-3-glycerol phosphate synthase n=1 Tax=Caldimicrobium thiodismutans TaxID=1653476 RepID=A0A832GLW8_9BACT
MHKILENILFEKYFEILKRKQRGLYFRPFWDRPPFDLKRYLEKEGFIIIAEIKKGSPLKGTINRNFNPLSLAEIYQRAGAKAISVITEEIFFYGSLEYLAGVRSITSLPLLRKDFIFDPVQIEEAKAFGADFLLLIAGILPLEELKELYKYTYKLGLSALVEVHSEEDVEKALKIGAEVIGINNRDLNTLKVDTEHAPKMLTQIPKNIFVIAESGINTAQEVKILREMGFKGVLIGTALVKSPNPEKLLREMVEVAYGITP